MRMCNILATFAFSSNAAKCFTCKAKNWKDCKENGTIERCEKGEVCQLVERRKAGFVYRINMGCKARKGCQSGQSQNFAVGPHQFSHEDLCRPEATGEKDVSVCKTCCISGPRCGLEFEGGQHRPDWDLNLLFGQKQAAEMGQAAEMAEVIQENM